MKHNGAPACTLTTPNGFSKLFGGSDFVLRREHRYFKGDKPTMRSALPPIIRLERPLTLGHGSYSYICCKTYQTPQAE